MVKPKGLSGKPASSRYNKQNKLPPRLAKQKEQREKGKETNRDIMPKIEQWDNDLANNIPAMVASEMESAKSNSSYIIMNYDKNCVGKVELFFFVYQRYFSRKV